MHLILFFPFRMFTYKYHTGPLDTQYVISAPGVSRHRIQQPPLQSVNAVAVQLFDLLYFLYLGWFSSWLIAVDSDHLCTGGTETALWLRSGSSWGHSPPSQSGCDDALFERQLGNGTQVALPLILNLKWALARSESAPDFLRTWFLFRSLARLCLGPMCSPGCPQLSWGNSVYWGTFKPKPPSHLQCTMLVPWCL